MCRGGTEPSLPLSARAAARPKFRIEPLNRHHHGTVKSVNIGVASGVHVPLLDWI
jgi:hypothetical protein